ncbi:MAG: hypothetical protein AAFW73_26995, partial [Bacteroidota bacterium]
RRALELKRKKEEDARMRQRRRHMQEMKEAEVATTPVSLKDVKPFVLESEIRHERYEREFEEKIRREDLERKRLAEFHARPIHSPARAPQSSSSPRSGSSRGSGKRPTEFVPFHLSTDERHQKAMKAQEEKQRLEAVERMRRANFRAQPVPRSTYVYKATAYEGSGGSAATGRTTPRSAYSSDGQDRYYEEYPEEGEAYEGEEYYQEGGAESDEYGSPGLYQPEEYDPEVYEHRYHGDFYDD